MPCWLTMVSATFMRMTAPPAPASSRVIPNHWQVRSREYISSMSALMCLALHLRLVARIPAHCVNGPYECQCFDIDAGLCYYSHEMRDVAIPLLRSVPGQIAGSVAGMS